VIARSCDSSRNRPDGIVSDIHLPRPECSSLGARACWRFVGCERRLHFSSRRPDPTLCSIPHLSLAQLGPTTVGASNHLARLLFREHPVHFTSLPLLLACILSSCFGTLLPACLPTPRLTPRLTRDSTTWKSAFANTAELSAQVSLLRQLIPPPLISTPHAHAAFSPAAGPSHHVRLRRARA
jgi:hypothetical protein